MSTFRDRPQTVLARRVLFQVHLWLGILTGFYIFVVCATGVVLVFRIDIQRAMLPTLFTPRTSGPLVDPVTVMDSVQNGYPDSRVSGVEAPTTTRPTYLAYAVRGDRFITLLLDPVSAELLGEVPEQSFVRTLQDLHFDLLGGRRGRIANGVGAIVLFGMCATGLVIWLASGPGSSSRCRLSLVHTSCSRRRFAWPSTGSRH